ncbi:hypothetical protein COY27_02300 [Candidatus Woesearchaeota archaeon CG_4_10_14_0_2_um_filter_33_13]|nr:MAG: hypothetical protein COY27_02300 [Candidatus Woesearchaeota archaeon CG_4_10_14_0_2_um_filter_33_13]
MDTIDYKFERESDDRTLLHCYNKGYRLEYDQRLPLLFRFSTTTIGERRVSITARNLESSVGSAYHPDLAKIARNPDPKKTYLEVGAGLGEFTILPGVIVIDPADFQLMRSMLLTFRPYVVDKDLGRFEEVLGRCNRMLNPKQVKLLNIRLSQALARNQLGEVADLVVDNFAAFEYRSNVEGCSYEDILMMEGTLLKDGGLLYTDEYVYQKEKGRMVAIK